jgi:hypothetical protein
MVQGSAVISVLEVGIGIEIQHLFDYRDLALIDPMNQGHLVLL